MPTPVPCLEDAYPPEVAAFDGPNQQQKRLVQSQRRAIVVDNHAIIAEALSMAISSMSVFERIDSAVSVDDACKSLETGGPCRLVILDLHHADSKGRETVVALRERFPEVPILVFTGDGSLDNITRSFECGASGFVTKTSHLSVVRSAIGLVLAGGTYISPEVPGLLGFPTAASDAAPVIAPDATELFSAEEEQVFRMLLKGLPRKVIGARLDMDEGSVNATLTAVFRILDVRTRVEAILRARQLGIV